MASGAGERFGAFKTPKHLTPTRVPVLIWTLKTSLQNQIFEKILILVREQDLIFTQNYVDKFFSRLEVNCELSLGVEKPDQPHFYVVLTAFSIQLH